jgi:hypothetical protein
MIRYVFPILDIITASALFLHTRFGWFAGSFVVLVGIYMAAKGLAFAYSDFASKIDIIAGAYIIIAGLGLFMNATVSMIVFVWLMQKAVFALIPLR